ncbi:MAG: gliding motility lipoprotein GldD [Bacteroidia bacterium]|nr:gliding motility lipoprotein GldD [Bacteroidia bacterium]
MLCFKTKFLVTAVIVSLLISLPSCDDEDTVYSPKPRGYCRIDFPEKKYRLYDSICPYTFEIPVYSHMTNDKHKGAELCWLNLEFPQFRATVHLSYKPVENNIAKYLDDSHDFANRHQVKATGLDEITILRDSARVYGLLFDISGNTASSLQFYLTDSTKHFLRGALYFNSVPNIDSLKVVVDFLKKDVMHMINTTKWKRQPVIAPKS